MGSDSFRFLDAFCNVILPSILGHLPRVPAPQSLLCKILEWFGYMLDAVLEVARPNSGLDGQAREFLKDMRDGIALAEAI